MWAKKKRKKEPLASDRKPIGGLCRGKGGHPFPLPGPPLGSLRSPTVFLSDPVFCLFSPLRQPGLRLSSKPYPIPDQIEQSLYPFSDQNGAKTLPFGGEDGVGLPIERLRFSFTKNGKRHTQVDNFLRENLVAWYKFKSAVWRKL